MTRLSAPARHSPRHTLPGLAVTVFVLLPLLAACDAVCERCQPVPADGQPLDSGYAVLKMLLGDEAHLDTLRVVKSAITFTSASDPTVDLVDDIATVSARGLDELDRLVTQAPVINLETSAEERLGSDILDALRVVTAWDLLSASGDDFELTLVLSQVQALRLISQLLEELRELDPNPARQAWLENLASDYEALYDRAVARLSVN
jgi:hypothetical protein